MASGNTLLVFKASSNDPPSSNFAAIDVATGALAGLSTLAFNDATAQAAVFSSVLPRAYASGGLTITIHWKAYSAVSGAVVWGASFERHQPGVAAAGFTSESTVTSTAAGSTDAVQTCVLTFSNGAPMGYVAAAEHFSLKIRRSAADGADTMTGNACFVAVEIKET